MAVRALATTTAALLLLETAGVSGVVCSAAGRVGNSCCCCSGSNATNTKLRLHTTCDGGPGGYFGGAGVGRRPRKLKVYKKCHGLPPAVTRRPVITDLFNCKPFHQNSSAVVANSYIYCHHPLRHIATLAGKNPHYQKPRQLHTKSAGTATTSSSTATATTTTTEPSTTIPSLLNTTPAAYIPSPLLQISTCEANTYTFTMAPIALDTPPRSGSRAVSRSASPFRPFDTSFPQDVRKQLHIRGLIPPVVESFEVQKKRCLEQIAAKTTSIDKYMYLSNLRNTNTDLFYRLLIDNMKEITPLVYTPVVGEACVKWSHIYTQPEGLYLSWSDRGNLRSVLENWPAEQVDIVVVTDGSRILGLGDLGVNGMGIPVGKLALYIGCAGIDPRKTLPITLDLGTNNETNLADPMYLGAKMKRVSEEEELEYLDEMMIALNDKWPGLVVQFEDFKNPFPSLERYRNTYTAFNDDIQGTGAVILAGVMNGFKMTGVPLSEHRLVFMGAGSAAVGVAKQIVELFIKNGMTEDEARRQFWLVDSKGLVTLDRGDRLAKHKLFFARDDNEGRQFGTLEEIVDFVQPTALMGLCTTGGVFTESIIRKMAKFNERPMIFPLSNPSHKSECTFEQAMQWTDGKVVFASGSPFPTYNHKGRDYVPGQGNNMYVFPGIGLGTIVCQATHITQDMIYASAAGLASSLNDEEKAKGWLYPDLRRIREVSVVVARNVIRTAQAGNLDRKKALQKMSDEELDAYIRKQMYDPTDPLASRAGSGANSPTHEDRGRL